MNLLPDPSRRALSRNASERWLAGVCAGLAMARDVRVSWVRAAFVALTLVGGLGLGLYLACWMILPREAATGGAIADEHAGAVTLARAAGAAIGLFALALFATVATVFGFGWIAFGLAAVALVNAGWRRLGSSWSVLPVAALTVPAVAVAASPVHLDLQSGERAFAPATAAVVRSTTYHSGLGTMFIDLRHTRFPATGTIPLTIRAGVRRTIVALPHNTCVHVQVGYRVHPFAANLGALLTGRNTAPFSPLVLFGRYYGASGASSGPLGVSSSGAVSGPTLVVDFSSQGGSLYVRDYPDTVNPTIDPGWPGFQPPLDPKPMQGGATRKGYEAELRYWHHRVAQERVWRAQFDTLIGGPCA